MNRRQFIIGSSAAFATAAVVGIPTALAAEQVAPVVAAARRGSWGYSTASDYWYLGFDSRERAFHEAAEWGFHFEVGWCTPRQLDYPDMREGCAEWLSIHSETGGLGSHLSEAIEDYNDDNDFEGEVGDAFRGVETRTLDLAAMQVLTVALMRHERIDIVVSMNDAHCAGPFCGDEDSILDVLMADEVLGTELEAVALAWAKANKLHDAPCVLDLADVEHFDVMPKPKSSDLVAGCPFKTEVGQ